MTVELQDLKFQRRKYRKFNVPKYTLPRARYERGGYDQPLRKYKRWAATDVSHGSKEGNSVRMLSIPRTHRLGRTTPRSLHGAICRPHGDSSTGQGERAKFGYLSAICHLPVDLSTSREQRQYQSTDVSICSCRSPFYVGFLMLVQTQNWFVISSKLTESFLDIVGRWLAV